MFQIFYSTQIFEGEKGLVYERKGFTPWKFEVEDIRDEEDFEGVFRTAFSNGKECERFTLLPKDSNHALIQIEIYKNKDYQFWSVTPCNVYIDWDKKHVYVKMLFDLEI